MSHWPLDKQFQLAIISYSVVKTGDLPKSGQAPVAQKGSHQLPCNAGGVVRSLGQENPQEKGMGTQVSILAWRIPWTENPGGL